MTEAEILLAKWTIGIGIATVSINVIAVIVTVIAVYKAKGTVRLAMGGGRDVTAWADKNREDRYGRYGRGSPATDEKAERIATKGGGQVKQARLLYSRYKFAIEECLDAYDHAVRLYLDNKIDRERFAKNYKDPIRELCESKVTEIMEILHPAETSKFKAIWTFYREWQPKEEKK